MNAEVAYGYRERKAQAQAVGEVAHRLHCLQHLKLKTVIKASLLLGSAGGTGQKTCYCCRILYYTVSQCSDTDERSMVKAC